MQASFGTVDSSFGTDMQAAFMPPAPVPAPPNPLSPVSMTPRSQMPSDSQHPLDSQETASSQGSKSPNFQLSSSDVSQLTINTDTSHSEISPVSSQEHDTANAIPSPTQSQTRTQPQTNLAEASSSSHVVSSSQTRPTGDLHREFISGQKRTSSGQMKRASITSIEDLKKEQASTRNSRTSSILSNGSNGNVMELSQQLRTRLSYAMVKVNNGWQSNTLDELETLASQQGSPRSSLSGFQSKRHSMQSPRTAMAANWPRKWSSSEGSDGSTTRPSVTSANSRGKPNGSNQVPTIQAPSRRVLAPPVDIISGNRRRPNPNGPLNGTSTTGPYTPSRHFHSSTSTPTQRTPSLNAAMEADAVETLLFMASPVNSGYHANTSAATESNLRSTAPMSSSQPSPLRTQFSFEGMLPSPRKTVGFADPLPSTMTSTTVPTTTTTTTTTATRDLERMLDESDESSNDGLDEAISLVNQRQRTGLVRGH